MSKYSLVLSGGFKRDLKLAVKRKCDISKLEEVVELLLSGEPLPEKYISLPATGQDTGSVILSQTGCSSTTLKMMC